MRKLIVLLLMALSVYGYSQSTPAVLSNFRVENSNKDRVYFDASGDLTGLTTAGFVISGKKITGVNSSGKYFTVSEPFTFWDNNTIRLGEITDQGDRQKVLHNFTLRYIENNIPEPKGTGSVYYVSTSGSDKNDGKSEAKSWKTITYAAGQVKAGDVVYVKAGDYGSESLTISKSGTSNNPIKIIGYKNSPGDVKNGYFTYGRSKIEQGEMPLFSGNGLGTCITIKNSNYLIIENLQIVNYAVGIESNSQQNIYSNLVIKDIGLKGGNTGFGLILSGGYNRVLNSVVMNVSNSLIRTFKNGNLIDNFKGYSDYGPTNPPSTDYFISIYKGSNNIVRNSYVERVGEISHGGHGVSLKSSGVATEHNLIENSSIVNIQQSIELRHSDVRFTIARNITATGNREKHSNLVTFRDGTSYNVVEESYANGTNTGIRFTMNAGEDKGIQAGGHHNKVKNTIFNNVKYAIYVVGIDGTPLKSEYNSIENCTFYDNQAMFTGSVEFNKTNTIANSIIMNIPKESITGAFNPTITNSNSYKSFSISGSGNMSLDPKFENPSQGNFRLKPDSPMIDKGKMLEGLKSDFEGKPRPSGKSIDIGAFEYQDKSTSQTTPVKADAGDDQVICSGNSATLTASGGTIYKWSTGATTASITVNPTQTTTYSVEVSDGSSSDTDEVLVTVNELPKANAGADQTITAGDSTTLTASEGDSYLWSTGETTASIAVSPAQTTSYEVTVSSNGCTSKDTVQVTVESAVPPTTVTADAGDDQIICKGNSTTLTASGGTIYKWSTGATTASITVNPTQTTTYSVEVSDGSSSDTDEVVVTVNELPKADAGVDQTITAGESATLNASGGDSYLWSTGETTASIAVSPNETTGYEVTVTSNGCTSKDTVQVTVNAPAPPTTVIADAGDDKNLCIGDSITLTASGGTQYKWSTGATTSSITVNPKATTTYFVTASIGDISDTDQVIVTVVNCNLSDNSSNPQNPINSQKNSEASLLLNDFTVYPNPTEGILHIKSDVPLNNYNLVLMNLNGNILYSNQLEAQQSILNEKLDLSRFEKGIYLMQLYNDEGSYVKKVMVM